MNEPPLLPLSTDQRSRASALLAGYKKADRSLFFVLLGDFWVPLLFIGGLAGLIAVFLLFSLLRAEFAQMDAATMARKAKSCPISTLSLEAPVSLRKYEIYNLLFAQIFQKTSGGYLFRMNAPFGGDSTSVFFLRTDLDFDNGTTVMDYEHYAICIGTYSYTGLDGFGHQVPELQFFNKESDRIVVDRVNRRQFVIETTSAR